MTPTKISISEKFGFVTIWLINVAPPLINWYITYGTIIKTINPIINLLNRGYFHIRNLNRLIGS